MVATLSGRIQSSRDCLEIEFLFDRALRGQTSMGFPWARQEPNAFAKTPPVKPEGDHAVW